MTHTLENDELSIGIKSAGAEICSIRSKNNNTEYIWQGNPSVWTGQAPVLFPIIGMLKDGKYSHKGQEYAMPKHGFIRHNKNLEISKKTDSLLKFQLKSSKQTKIMFPFDFVFEIEFKLVKSTLEISHTVRNTGEENLYFSIGGHPAFNCPLQLDEKYNDYSIQIENAQNCQSHSLNENGLISNETFSILENNEIKLKDDLFNNDALIFKNIKGKEAILRHTEKGPILKVTYNDFSDLGVWAKPKAPFVCIEPWLGYADVEGTTQELSKKEGIQTLAPESTHNSTYSIRIY